MFQTEKDDTLHKKRERDSNLLLTESTGLETSRRFSDPSSRVSRSSPFVKRFPTPFFFISPDAINNWQPCGKRASHAKYILETWVLCAEHVAEMGYDMQEN